MPSLSSFSSPHLVPSTHAAMPHRILLFTDTLGDVNGVSRFLQSLARLALQHRLHLTILTSTRVPVPDLSNIINLPPLLAVPLPGYPDLELALPPWRALDRLARELRPDAVHVSTPGPVGLLGARAARRLGVPILATYHTDFPAYVHHLFDDPILTHAARAFMRRVHLPCDRVLVRSDAYRPPLLAMGVAPARLRRLTPGIRLQDFHPRFRDRAIWRHVDHHPASALRVLYVGRVSVEKNLPMLVEAWREIDSRATHAVLTIVGDGPYLEPMRAALVGTRTSFLGVRHAAELSRLYASSDLFVFPSTTDTLGQVVLEAQASGLATLVSDQGGPREVVRHAVTGLALPARRDAWVSAIVNLLDDHAQRHRLAAAAHEHAQQFSIEGTFERFWREHEDAIAARAVPDAKAPPGP